MIRFPWVIVRRKRYEALLAEVETLRTRTAEPTPLDIRRERFEKRLEAVARSIVLEGIR